MAALGFGITITVSGNFEQQLTRAKKGIDGLNKGTQDLNRTQARSSSIALKTAAAFGLLGGAAVRLSQKFSNLSKSMVSFFRRVIDAGARFQEAMLGLKVFFGDDSETLAAAVLNIANQSDVALTDVVNIARRLGPFNLSMEQSAKATRILTQAISTLSGQARTRAIQGIANILENPSSAARLLDTAFTEAEKSQVKFLKGAQKTGKIIELLELRFGNVNAIMRKGFGFGVRQLTQLIDVFFARISEPVLQSLVPPLAKVVQSLNRVLESAEGAKKIIEPLQKIFSSIISPLEKLINVVADLDLVPKFLEFLANNPGLVKTIAFLGTVGAATAGILTGLAAKLLLVGASISLIAGSGILTSLGGLFASIGGSIGAFFSGGLALIALKVLSISVALVALAGVFKAAFGPAVNFVADMAKSLSVLTNALFQAFTTGEVTSDVVNNLTERGLIPFFRVIVTGGARVIAFFKGIFSQISTLGPVFADLFGVVKFAFFEVGKALEELFISFGLMSRGGVNAFGTVGGAVGFVLKAVTGLQIFLSSNLVVALVGVFKIVVGVFSAIANMFRFIAGAINAIVGSILLAATKIPFLGKQLGIDSSVAEGFLASGTDLLASGAQGFGNAAELIGSGFSGRSAQLDRSEINAGDKTINLMVQNQLNLDGEKVAQNQQKVRSDEQDQFNEFPELAGL